MNVHEIIEKISDPNLESSSTYIRRISWQNIEYTIYIYDGEFFDCQDNYFIMNVDDINSTDWVVV